AAQKDRPSAGGPDRHSPVDGCRADEHQGYRRGECGILFTGGAAAAFRELFFTRAVLGGIPLSLLPAGAIQPQHVDASADALCEGEQPQSTCHRNDLDLRSRRKDFYLPIAGARGRLFVRPFRCEGFAEGWLRFNAGGMPDSGVARAGVLAADWDSLRGYL